MKQKQAHGHAKKHTGTAKHTAAKPKHHPAHQHAHHQPAKAHHPKTAHTKAKHPQHTKARGLTLGDVQCCAAEALAWSLRLSGWPVGDADVLALYKLTADSPDAGASILGTLDAACVFGLAGVRPSAFQAVRLLAGDVPTLGEQVVADFDDNLTILGLSEGVGEQLYRLDAAQLKAFAGFVPDRPAVHGLILGVDLPGPHTVVAAAGGWITWGRWHDPADFPDAVVEEAWVVTWP